MTEKELKDLIVSQAKEIQELKQELEITESLRRFGWSQYQGAKERISKLEEMLAPKPPANDDISIGLTD